ncbi:MAG: YdcF family protein [Bacteroidetes bacterium]|nr:YdcF family protein [Bacteroidota bacterium]
MKNFRNLIIMFSITAMLFGSFRLFAKNPDKTIANVEVNAPYDAIIVPGVPYNDEDWSRVLMARIYWSYYLYKNGYTKNIIYSGSAVYTPYIESKIMSLYGQELGIPEKHIFIETNAEHSVENVYYSYHLAQDLGLTKVALATDPFQSRFMKGPSKRMDVPIDFIPFSTELLDTLNVKEMDIPAEQAFVEDFIPLTEREGFFKRLGGTLGRKIEYRD